MLTKRAAESRSELRILTCGSVDDGKSTLVGRLINDSVGIHEDQLAVLQAESRRFGTVAEDERKGIDFALLLDGLEAEREQGITIDVAWRFFATPRRSFIVADTPGHRQYTRNMVTGASNVELAVLLVDAKKGLAEQTRRHATIVSLLGIRHVVLAVNKMDLVNFSEERFQEIEASFLAFSAHLKFQEVIAIPLSARFGDNVVTSSPRMPWFKNVPLLAFLENVEVRPSADREPMRFLVQLVNRPNASFRGLAGMIVSGSISVGDAVVVAGSGQTTQIERIVTFDGDLPEAGAGRSVTLTFSDETDVSRGDVLADPKRRPTVTRRLEAELVWMSDRPCLAGQAFLMKIGTATVPVVLSEVVDTLLVESFERVPASSLSLNATGRVHLEAAQTIAFDPYSDSRETGGFILIDRVSLATVAAGMVVRGLDRATNVYRQATSISSAMRAAAIGQRPLVVWLTGLPSSGKSTLANMLEARLVGLGYRTMLLDGDNLRFGLNVDLGFDTAARSENVRRVGEVAKLMMEAGLIVIVALVSPFRADRLRVAEILPPGRFFEVFVDASLEVCQRRDVKGLYARAARGEVPNMTGQGQPYEVPYGADLILKTDTLGTEETGQILLEAVLHRM